MSNIKLVYFDVRGLGEPARLILKHAKVNFKDERILIGNDDWSSLKPKTKNGKLPYLEFDGHTIFESYAIHRFLARKYKLAGKDDFEAALVDSIADVQKDFYNACIPWLIVERKYKPGNPEDFKKEHLDDPIKQYFPMFCNFLKESKSGFMAPSGVTWVDFVITEFFTTLIQSDPTKLDSYPELKEYLNRVHNVPELKEYYAKRPDVY